MAKAGFRVWVAEINDSLRRATGEDKIRLTVPSKSFSSCEAKARVLHLFHMKKSLSSREFLHGFKELCDRLKAGETINVTRHGKTLGSFTKETAGKRKAPDYLANLQKLGGSTVVGQKVIDEICGLS
jgi:hypothetical protein